MVAGITFITVIGCAMPRRVPRQADPAICEKVRASYLINVPFLIFQFGRLTESRD